MIKVIKAYYDGQSIIPMQKYSFKPQQQVLIVVEENKQDTSAMEKFLQLSWQGEESAEEILADIEKNRVNSKRFNQQLTDWF